MIRFARAAVFAIFVGSSLTGAGVRMAGAQTSLSTSLEGAVRDQTGAVVAGATVSVRAVDSALERFVDTARDGSFRVAGLPLGRYSVLVSATVFAVASVDRQHRFCGQRSDALPFRPPVELVEVGSRT